jgi:hypothetical protein
MRDNGVILLTRERVKVRAKVDNLIVPHAAIRKSPILKVIVAAVLVLVAQLPLCKLNTLKYLLALSLFGMIFINTTPLTLGTVGMDSERTKSNSPIRVSFSSICSTVSTIHRSFRLWLWAGYLYLIWNVRMKM